MQGVWVVTFGRAITWSDDDGKPSVCAQHCNVYGLVDDIAL